MLDKFTRCMIVVVSRPIPNRKGLLEMDTFTFGKEFSPQYPVSLVEQITEFLTNAIIEGRLIGGQRLVENELQRRFGISRAPIRESLRVLETNGLVTTVPRKGTFVRRVTKTDIEENFPIRAYLESLAARSAVPKMGRRDLESMEMALSRMVDAAKKNDFKSYFSHHTRYHDIFIQASHNDTLISILQNLRRQALWFRFSYLYHQENYEYALRVHQEILDLFHEKQDQDRLERLVRDHILIALDRFLAFLNSKSGEADDT